MSNEKLLENLGAIVRYHREQSGLNRVELARLAQVGKTSIFDIEHSKKTVRLDTLLKVLEVLNISVELNSPLMKAYKENINKDERNT